MRSGDRHHLDWCYARDKKILCLEKPWIECEWRDRCNRYLSTIRVTVINQHIAIGRACDRYDDGRNHENEFGAFVEPRISERLRVGFAQGPIVRQLAKRYVVNWNIIWSGILYHGLRRQQVGVSDVYTFLQCSERRHRGTIRHWAPSCIPAAAVRKPVPSIEFASAAQTR